MRNRLKGADQIALKVGAVRNKHKVGKHFEIEISDESLQYSRKVDKIRAEAALDGIYVVRINVPSEEVNANDTVKTYKSLSVVERAFRSMKTVDLKIRPIFHWKEERFRAHVLLCMLAYYVEWHMRQRLAPLLFEDHEPEVGAAMQRSAVDKAERSHAAKQKATLKSTEDGYVVESFRSRLAMLATIVKNWLCPHGSSAEPFTLTTKPNEHQQRALTLLDVAVGA